MFNKVKNKMKKEEKDLTKERDDRCVPIAKEFLSLVGKYEKGIIGDGKNEEIAESYRPLAKQILEMYLEKNIRVHESGYIHRLVLQSFQTVQDIIINSLNESLKKAEKEMWGKEASEITIKEIDEKIKK